MANANCFIASFIHLFINGVVATYQAQFCTKKKNGSNKRWERKVVMILTHYLGERSIDKYTNR